MAGEGLLAGRSTRRPGPDGARVFAPPTIQSPRARITSAGAVARSHGSGTSWPSRMTPIGPDEASEPLASMDAEAGLLHNTLSKCLAPSLRIGLRVVRTSILIAAPQSRVNLPYRAVSKHLGPPSPSAIEVRAPNTPRPFQQLAIRFLQYREQRSRRRRRHQHHGLAEWRPQQHQSGSARNDDKSSARSR
ncbi:hypothetical protein ACVWXL_009169 [Bradyrhizobium sp. GM22.5]